MAPENVSVQGPDAPLAHRRPGYSLSGCTPAEPDSASPGRTSIAKHRVAGKAFSSRPLNSDIGVGSWTRPNSPGGQSALLQMGKDAPHEIKRFGRPRRRCLDFLLLIGGLRLA